MMRFPIALKLIVLTVLLLLAATVPIALKSSEKFQEASGKREEDTTREQAIARASEVETMISNYRDRVRLLGTLYMKDLGEAPQTNSPFSVALQSDDELASVEVWKLTNGSPELLGRKLHESFFEKRQLQTNYLDTVGAARAFPIVKLFEGHLEIQNATLTKGAPLFALGVPLIQDDESGRITHVVVSYLALDRLQNAFSKPSERLMFLVTADGHLLAHPDEKRVAENEDVSAQPLVAKAMKASLRKGQMTFTENNEAFVGAYARNSFDMSVLVQVPREVILGPAREVRNSAFFITGAVLSLALFFIVLFSTTLTSPLEKLATVAFQIARGNLEAKAQITSRDEVGDLAQAFDHMTVGLKERDRMKNVLNKFHGSSVAEDLINRDAQLGGSRKNVTVFFSDIRDFTKFSEGHSPEEVVEMLNEYFRVMVAIIYKHKGIVDKFIGDAIMAVWGAPHSTPDDESNAAKCCLEMRQALAELNKSRLERNLTEIRIGMALHTGHAISGTIGSDERMEYTVIGDTVNMTSRIEASTKVFGTDLLISEMTAEILREQLLVEEAGRVEVKGKSEPLKLFKVRGYYDENRNPVLVQTPYSEYQAAHDDKVKSA